MLDNVRAVLASFSRSEHSFLITLFSPHQFAEANLSVCSKYASEGQEPRKGEGRVDILIMNILMMSKLLDICPLWPSKVRPACLRRFYEHRDDVVFIMSGSRFTFSEFIYCMSGGFLLYVR